MASIVEPDAALLDGCDREPVHLIGHIQSHGLLFALSEPDFMVRQVSANVEAVLGLPVDDVLECSLEAVLGRRQYPMFCFGLGLDVSSPLRVTVGSRGLLMNCIAHRHDGVLIAEFEPVAGAHSLPTSELAGNIEMLLNRMDRAADILDYAAVAAGEIARLSGFDRVMVYRFDSDWHGEVIAEVGGVPEPGVPSQISYLGLHFPATDIPAQARRLFLTNAVRSIADVASAPVPILPQIGPGTGRPLDMTHAFLRSSSLVHIEYLRNIGVQASLTVSIVVEERLWGLVACHHHTPRIVDYSIRGVCELIGRNLALQVALRQATAARHARGIARKVLDDYIGPEEAPNAGVDAASFRGAPFLELLDADGLVSRLNGVVSSQGVTVAEEALLPVISKLRALSAFGIASSDRLAEHDASAAAYASEVSGALLVELSKRSGDYLLFLRREQVMTVNWAGNPDKAASADPAGRLHPRTSFAQWQQTVRGRSRPWTELERETARLLRGELLHIRDTQRLLELEQRIRQKKPS
jgi:light-regulated signal transduction histidine kinase (bacteriophytochrome)